MAENLLIDAKADKKERYEQLLPQIAALIAPEPDPVANMANVAAALRQAMGFFWVGFYLYRDEELVLGPFQGPVACTRIGIDKGVCGAAYTQGETIVVEDVNRFPGHIACSSDSKSEIVVPLHKGEERLGVLDVDSDRFAEFDETDRIYLEKLCATLAAKL